MKRISEIVSVVMHPIFAAMYGLMLLMYTTTLQYTLSIYRFKLILFVISFTILLPLIIMFVLKKRNKISSISLSHRKERNLPLILVCNCYLLLIVTLQLQIVMPVWLYQILAGIVVVMLILSLVTLFWKISIHMASIGGMLGAAIALSIKMHLMLIPWIILGFILAGLLGSARLYLQRHTILQVLAGFLLGVVILYSTVIVDLVSLGRMIKIII